jgi:hypothetical protein
MHEMIERYVHQVGLYVRQKERAEIEAELRSQIQDQIDDRFEGPPTTADIAAILKQLGDPRTMAASYSGDQVLVGPELYPFMMTVLRIGVPLMPAAVVIANVVGAALSTETVDWFSLLISSLFAAVQAALIFFAAVVLIFAILQRSGAEVRAKAKADFDPYALPSIDDPSGVDRLESGIGIAIGTLVSIAIVYFLQVGGLTLRFNVTDPGDVLPVPTGWLLTLLISVVSNVALNLWALVRQRWTFVTWLAQSLVEFVGAIALYFAIYTPVAERIIATSPELAERLPIAELPWIITLFAVLTIVLMNGVRLIRLWQRRSGPYRTASATS